MVSISNNIRNINPNYKPFVSFKKSEDNKSQANKKVPSTTEIVLGLTAITALGVATFTLISSHKNKKAYEKILDEKISKKLDEKSNEIIDKKVVKTLNEKSTEIIDSKVTQKVQEITDQILDNKIQKTIENKASTIIENKFNEKFDKRFSENLCISWNTLWENIENNPEIKEWSEKFGKELIKLGDWIEKVDRKLEFIDSFNFFDIPDMNPLSMAKMYLPHLFTKNKNPYTNFYI